MELQDLRLLLEKTMWITSLERTQGRWAPPPGSPGPGVRLGAAARPHLPPRTSLGSTPRQVAGASSWRRSTPTCRDPGLTGPC